MKSRTEENCRARFFLAWRKRCLQEQVVGERRKNQDFIIVETVFFALKREWDLKARARLFELERRSLIAQRCLGALAQNVSLKHDKLILKKGAEKNYQLNLKKKAMRSLVWQATRAARAKDIRLRSRARTLKRGLQDWY